MKNNKGLLITLITLISILIIVLVTFLVLILSDKIKFPTNFSFNTSSISSESKLIYDEIYDVSSISNLKINTLSSDITFVESNDNNINVKVYGSKKRNLEVDLENNNLTINYQNHNICIGFCFDNADITISIPKSYNGNIKMNSKSGDMDLIDLENATMNLETISGSIRSGKVLDINANTVSGDIDIKAIKNNVKASTTSGDIKIKDLNLLKNSSLKSVSGDIEISKRNDIYIETNTISGDVNIRKNNRLAKNVLKIETVSGDINVF